MSERPSLGELLKQKRREILDIAARHGAYNVRVFGSSARGEEGPTSDLDLLVDVGPGRTFFFPGGLIADLEELLGVNVDVAEPEALHESMREQILQEARPV